MSKKTTKKAKHRRGTSDSKKLLAAFPTNWCDPLLTGAKAVIGKPPYDCQDIERLLLAVKDRVERAYIAGAQDERAKIARRQYS